MLARSNPPEPTSWAIISSPSPSLQGVLDSPEALGARRITLLAVQILTELQLAQRSNVALKPLELHSIRVTRSGTPFEQATLCVDERNAWQPTQERLGLEASGSIVHALSSHCLYLENSLYDERGRFGGLPLARRIDAPVLRRMKRALRCVANRCNPCAEEPYPDAMAALKDLNRLAFVINRIVANCRPSPPQYVKHALRSARKSTDRLPSVLLASKLS